MSFKFDHQGKKYWAKEMAKQTEVYLLERKGVAEKLFVLNDKPSLKEILSLLTKPSL